MRITYHQLLIQGKCSNFTLASQILFIPQALHLSISSHMGLKRFIAFYFFIHSLTTYGQEYNNWYFGNAAAISFNPGGRSTPHALPGLNSANEGNATINDVDGNLLFYTNGATIYNKLHSIMLNGNQLNGHVSAVQSSIIIPMPGNDSIFYVFTTDAIEDNFAKGYCYSIVNINHDGGKGEVITKNIQLDPSCSERLTAARHSNGTDAWIITNERASGVFKVWLLTCTGLQPNPVVSVTGVVLDQHVAQNMGMLKVSPDSKKICQTSFPDFDGLFPENFFQLFDFDAISGVLSNPMLISVPGVNYHECEFSPDSKLLYVSRAMDIHLDQFEATLASTALVAASRVSLPSPAGIYGMQTGPDGKIYLNHYQPSLSVISKPNIKGIGCMLEAGKIDLLGSSGVLGLPAAINDGPVDPYNNFSIVIIDSCRGDVQFTAYSDLPGIRQWSWDFGDGSTSALQNPPHHFNISNQVYKVRLTIRSSQSCAIIRRTKYIAAGGLSVKTDFSFISHCDSGFVSFKNKSVLYPDSTGIFSWEFGDGTISNQYEPVHIYPAPGLYSVKLKVSLQPSCLDDSTIRTLDFQVLNIQAGPDQTIDIGQSAQLSVTGGGSQFTWTPSTGLNNIHSPNPIAHPPNDITYVVTATNDAGCKSVDSVFIHVNAPDGIFIPSAFTPNNDGRNDVMRPIIGVHYNLVQFSIFDRWGGLVFMTREKNKGWDGSWHGKTRDPGAYIWLISVKDASGKLIEKKGMTVLIR